MMDVPNIAGLILSLALTTLGLYFGGHAIRGLVHRTVRIENRPSEVRGADASTISSVWLLYSAVLVGGGLVGIAYAVARQWKW
jgi:hypothetical protein